MPFQNPFERVPLRQSSAKVDCRELKKNAEKNQKRFRAELQSGNRATRLLKLFDRAI